MVQAFKDYALDRGKFAGEQEKDESA